MRPAFATFVAPAQARPELWRLGVGLVVFVAFYMVLTLGFLAAAWALLGLAGVIQNADPFTFAQDVIVGDQPLPVLVLLYSFAAMALAVFAAAALLQRRAPRTLFGPGRLFWRQAGVAALGVSAIYGLGSLVYGAPTGSFHVAPNLWLKLLPFALLGVAIQVTAEEVVFRGYLQQQLAARFSTGFIWLLVPALLFGVLHAAPDAGPNTWLLIGAATLFGVVAGDLTARTGSLGAACGFHFANNVFALLLFGTEGALSGLSLYLNPYALGDVEAMRGEIFLSVAFTLIAWLALRVVLRR